MEHFMPIFQKRKAQNLAPKNAAQGDAESGSMTVFGLGMSVGIVAAGGIALDSMYYESRRIAAQDALDRCSVMAALAQNRFDGIATGNESDAEKVAKAKQVAQDCMAKSGQVNVGLTTNVTTDNESRVAELSGNYSFASRRDSDENEEFELSSTAKQKLPNIELTIAIDISHYTFWQKAKDPIQKFINTVTAPDLANKITVNIIPFGKSVNLGTSVLNQFNMANQPPFSTLENRSCLLLPESNKDDIEVDLGRTYNWSWPLEIAGINRKTPFDPGMYVQEYTAEWKAANANMTYLHGTGEVEKLTTPQYYYSNTAIPNGNCQFMAAGNSVLLGAQVGRPGGTTPSPVTTKLNGITAYYAATRTTPLQDGNAAEGMKWALAAMDPSMRPIFRNINGTGEASGTKDRPLNYNTADSMKVLLFIPNSTFNLADGSFTPEGSVGNSSLASRVREIRPEYLDGSKPDPDIWRTPIPGTYNTAYRYSIRHDNAPNPAKPYWITYSSYNGSPEWWLEQPAQWAAAPFQYPGGPAPVRQSWRDIFEKMSVDYLISALYQVPMYDAGILPASSNYSYEKLANDFTYIATNSATAMNNFTALCNAAKAKGVIIYTLLGNGTANIGGDTTWNTRATLARTRYTSCATTSAHSFSVSVNSNTGSEVTGLNSALRLISSNIAQMTLTQ